MCEDQGGTQQGLAKVVEQFQVCPLIRACRAGENPGNFFLLAYPRYSMSAHRRIRNLAKGNPSSAAKAKDADACSTHTSECSICLMPVAVRSPLTFPQTPNPVVEMIESRPFTDNFFHGSHANHFSSHHARTSGTTNAFVPSSKKNIRHSSAQTAEPSQIWSEISRRTSWGMLGKCLTM